MFDKIFNKLNNLIKRCVVLKTHPNGSYAHSEIFMHKQSVAQFISPYGLASAPKDCFGICFIVGNNSREKICVALAGEKDFKNLKDNEVMVGNPILNTYIKFNEDGEIEIFADKVIVKKGIARFETDQVIIKNGILKFEQEANVSSNDSVNINAPAVNLGSGGAQIARKGDQVKVNVGGTDYYGEITSGGTNKSI